MHKRIFGLFLAVIMLVTALPMAAVAAPTVQPAEGDPKTLNKFSENWPTVDEAKDAVGFTNGWTVGRYNIEKGELELYSHVANAGASILGAEQVSNIWTSGGGMYYGISKTVAIDRGRLSTYIPTVRYTAPTNGEILYTLDMLDAWYNTADTANMTFEFAIYKNNVKIWPTDADSFTMGAKHTYVENSEDILDEFMKDADLPSGIEVKTGDTIDFRILNTNIIRLRVSPCVKYLRLQDTPEICGTSVDVSKDLGLQLSVFLDPAASRPGAKPGVMCWTGDGAEPDPATAVRLTEGVSAGNNVTVFTYGGLAAKQMTDKVNFIPYTYVDGDDTLYFGSKITTSLADTVKAEYQVAPAARKEALRELVNYGANAQYAFGYNTDDLANSFLSDAEKKSGRKAGTDVWAQSQDGTTGVNITKASLLLDQKVGLKLVAPLKDGVSVYRLEYATSADFSDVKTVDMTKTEDGLAYRGIFYVDFSDVTTTYYIRVSDGTGHGNTLTYSVESYVSRIIHKDIDDPEYMLAHSLLAFAYAAQSAAQ